MQITKRTSLLIAMLTPVLFLVGWMMVGGSAARPASPGPALWFPPDDPETLPQSGREGTRGPSALVFSPNEKKCLRGGAG